MSLYLLTVSLGNLITGLVNSFIQKDDGGSLLPGASYFWFFTGLMFLGALLLGLVARNYQGKTYIEQRLVQRAGLLVTSIPCLDRVFCRDHIRKPTCFGSLCFFGMRPWSVHPGNQNIGLSGDSLF